MLRRNVGFGFFVFGAFVVATACGGTVKQGTENPGEQLRTDGPGRCKAACAIVVACGLDSSSCDCACACPDGGTDCACAPCMCETMTSGSASCERECENSVNDVLAEQRGCEAPMLALLDCVASATCKKGEVPCKPEQQAFKECGQKDRATITPPMSSHDNPGTPPGSGHVTCQIAGGFGAGAAPGAPPSAPGDLSCGSQFEECSDGRSYQIECRYTAGTELSCACLVDDVGGASFPATSCEASTDALNALCGWDLG